MIRIKKILFFLIIVFLLFNLNGCSKKEETTFKENNNIVEEKNSLEEKTYKYVLEVISGGEITYRYVANKDIKDDDMKEIYEKNSGTKVNYSVWFFETEDDARNLDSYNVAEIKKENNNYKIHRYGEETEEEKTIRLEKERLEKEEAEKKKLEEEKAKKEQEEKEFKESCKTYTFKEMARNPNEFKGTNVKLTGEVIQTIYGTINTQLRVNITKSGSYSTYYTDTIYVTYYPEIGEDKILEDDIITLWGVSQGDISYTSTLGAPVTLPHIYAKYITIND